MAGSESMSAIPSEIARIPQAINNVKTGVTALRSVVNVPAAAAGTGSPMASAAIVLLGASLVKFILMTAEALEQDIAGAKQTVAKVTATDQQIAQDGQRGAAALTSGAPS